jgi:hypothetical protein
LSWALAAWLSWGGLILATGSEGAEAGRYLALCLTGCAGIAVLGARRPIVGAWNLVLVGLLAVLLLPLAEHAVLGTPLLDPLRLLFIAGTLAVGVLNYLPTSLAGPVVLVGLAAAAEMLVLLEIDADPAWQAGMGQVSSWLVPLALWLGWLTMRRRGRQQAEFDREWLKFRDRFGLLWGQRVRDQFNQVARNADWPVILRWSGLRRTSRARPLPLELQTAIVDALRALLKRFEEPQLTVDSDH